MTAGVENNILYLDTGDWPKQDLILSAVVSCQLIIINTAVQTLFLLTFVIGNQLTLQCKSSTKFNSKGTAQLWSLTQLYSSFAFKFVVRDFTLQSQLISDY